MERKRTFRPIRLLLLLIIIVCLIPVIRFHFSSMQHRKQQEALRNAGPHPEDAGPEIEFFFESSKGSGAPTVPDKDIDAFSGHREILPKLQALFSENPDLAGWLFIEGTDINYPVMMHEDDEYYLSHNFYQEKDKYGCLFVRKNADLHTPGTNFIIYGHNMKDGSMFGKLDAYQSEDFYREHPVVSFDTLYESRSYEVIAAFPAQVYHEDTANQTQASVENPVDLPQTSVKESFDSPQASTENSVFKYYQFYQADTEEEFLYFYNNIKKLSLYDTGVTAKFGDTFLTLSTCSYHTEDGRFVVIAVRK